jgi:hypothetical protein
MKRFLFGGLLALGLAVTATPARADFYFEADCCRHWSMVRTCKQRCWTFNSCCNPLPCISHCASGGSSGLTPWHGPGPYGYPAAAAPVAAAPVAPAPAGVPAFKAPAPAPVTKTSATVQQAGYFYYGQAENTGYNYGTGSGYGYYGYGAGYSYAQAPNYWY